MSEWFVERAPCRLCGHRYATYEAAMAHSVYEGKRLVRCLDPVDCGLFFDGVEWTHIPPAPREVSLGQKVTMRPVRRTDTSRLTCGACGTLFSKRPGRGRPPKNCYDCRGAA